LASGALTDILPHGMLTDQDKRDLQVELQDMYDSAVADVMSKIRMVCGVGGVWLVAIACSVCSCCEDPQSTEAQLRQQIETAKHRLFQKMVKRVRKALAQQFPEAADALAKLQTAHRFMFLSQHASNPEPPTAASSMPPSHPLLTASLSLQGLTTRLSFDELSGMNMGARRESLLGFESPKFSGTPTPSSPKPEEPEPVELKRLRMSLQEHIKFRLSRYVGRAVLVSNLEKTSRRLLLPP
jgi:hypothetical protein